MEDFDTLVTREEFREIGKTADGQVKLLVSKSVDGGSDKAPKNTQTMAAGIFHFTLYDIDAVFFLLMPQDLARRIWSSVKFHLYQS